ncbi:MAG: tryptophan-rich sensory protein [Clostridia bacterium]|nr:tryptophan-rich sensory protein [Oscillospiraceae bacterium]MBQ7032649.1 tryptophan-rich sensory protein [Clostridia bacterium]
MHKKTRVYIVSILIPLAVGALSALLTRNSMEDYAALAQPPLSPPGWLFPIVWTILYTLMGISSARIYLSSEPKKNSALRTYAVQLAVNFFWTILFFNLDARLLALVWLILLDILVIRMIVQFRQIDRPAALLQIPYLLWLLFATYLNAGVWLLNR